MEKEEILSKEIIDKAKKEFNTIWSKIPTRNKILLSYHTSYQIYLCGFAEGMDYFEEFSTSLNSR